MYKGTLIAVKDMEESRKFYHDILGMDVPVDYIKECLECKVPVCQGIKCCTANELQLQPQPETWCVENIMPPAGPVLLNDPDFRQIAISHKLLTEDPYE